jgi:hypothetical protein
MQDDESIPEQTSSVTAVNSSNWRRTAIAIVITAFVAGTSGYLLGIRTNQNVSQSTQIVSFQPSPTITAQSTASTPSPSTTQAVPTPSFKIYRNERLGFEFKYLEGYEVMQETTNRVSFGARGFPYLTISINQITDYKSYRPCEDIDETNRQTFTCLESGEGLGQEGAIIETKLGQVSAKSFYILEWGTPHGGSYRIVQTNGSPKVEAKMFISGGGLDWQFEQMLSTFELLDNM